MTFTSWSFLAFLAAVLAVYFLLGHRWRCQNIILLLASYVSYAFWDWRFLGLLAGMTAINYGAGWAIAREQAGTNRIEYKRPWLALAIVFDLLALATFKYFNFFAESLVNLFSMFGLQIEPVSLKIILPLGISFFTFMSITYPFDIYRGKLSHTKNFLDVALFIAFFPTTFSGPVERAAHMLPQFQSPRVITSGKINEGLWLIAWGFFQKLVIAENLGLLVNRVYDNHLQFYGLDIVIATFAYGIQLLADFGGYTDIARGVARLFGFELFLNFNVPYFAINPSDFWSRWHISLSQWFRDYVYISLGGNRKGKWRTSLNLMITMILVGLWHGAAWTFVIWGAWHGLLLVVYRLFGKSGQSIDRTITGLLSGLSIVSRTVMMMVLVTAGWAAFRAASLEQFAYLFTHMGFASSSTTFLSLWRLIFLSLPMVIIQIFQLRTASPVFIAQLHPMARGLVYGMIIVGIIVFSPREISRFIYQGF